MDFTLIDQSDSTVDAFERFVPSVGGRIVSRDGAQVVVEAEHAVEDYEDPTVYTHNTRHGDTTRGAEALHAKAADQLWRRLDGSGYVVSVDRQENDAARERAEA